MATVDERLPEIAADLADVAARAKDQFGSLSLEQLNWKPAAKSWSIAQCFDHLITTHGQYFPVFERIASGRFKTSMWERISPLSGFFGRFLIRNLSPENSKKMKTTSRAQPSAGEIDGDIIERYGAHQQEMIEHLQALPGDLDAAKVIITSPLMGLVTYSLDDCFTIVAVHGKRHFL